MKKSLQLTALISIVLISVAFNNKPSEGKYSSLEKHAALIIPKKIGSPTGRTGAPGESNCTVSCHAGSTLDGTTMNSVTFSGTGNKYIAGQTYTMSLTMTDGSAKNGFQMVGLRDSDDTNIGRWAATDGTNTSVSSGGGRSYMNHTSAGTSLNTWTFDWTAPSTDEGDITFYMATAKSNSSNNNSGDEIYLSQFNITSDISNGMNEHSKIDSKLHISHSVNQLSINVTLLETSTLFIQLIDLNGKVVFKKEVGNRSAGKTKETITIPNLEAGIYIANLFVDNKAFSRKIVVK